MNKTEEKAKLISEVVDELNKWKLELGDVEVFIANTEDSCFDGVGKMFAIHVTQNSLKAVGIIRSKIVLKP